MGQAFDIQPKIYSTDQKFRPQRKISWWRLIFLFLVLAGMGYLLFFSRYFNISDVVVEGADSSRSKDIKNIVEQNAKGKNLFLFQKESTEKQIVAGFAEISFAAIYRGVPNALKVRIIERKPTLIWQVNDKNFLVDQVGVAFKETSDTKKLPIVIDQKENSLSTGTKVASKGFVAFIVYLVKNIEKTNSIKIMKILVPESNFEIHVVTDQGWQIYFDTTRPAKLQLGALNQVLPQIKGKVKEYIDLRTDNWAYYK